MRKYPFHIGTGSDFKPQQDLWRPRMPSQIYIRPEPPPARIKKIAPKPVSFGRRGATPYRIVRRFSLARLVSLFYGPRKTRRTKLR